MNTYRACFDVGRGIVGRVVRDFWTATLEEARVQALAFIAAERPTYKLAYINKI